MMSCKSSPTTAGRLTAALLFASAAVCGIHAEAAPYEPESDQVVLATLPASAQSSMNRPMNRSGDLQSVIAQAIDDIESARTSGDPRYLGYAQALLGPWWTMKNPPPQVALLRAQIHQHNHHFEAALVDLDYALSQEPRNAQGRLTRAAIHQVQGNYTAAEADCRSLLLLAPPLTTADCLSRVNGHRGQARVSYERLLAVRDRVNEIDARQLKEVDLTLADMASRLGDDRAAREHYTKALSAAEVDAYTLATFADFLLDQREFHEVLALAARYPSHQDLLLRAALAARATNAANSRDLAQQLERQYLAHQRRGDFVPSRDYARFLLDIQADAPAALKAALTNWKTQREPADARIVLRAALACDCRQTAAPVIAFVERNELEDLRLNELISLLGPERMP